MMGSNLLGVIGYGVRGGVVDGVLIGVEGTLQWRGLIGLGMRWSVMRLGLGLVVDDDVVVVAVAVVVGVGSPGVREYLPIPNDRDQGPGLT